MTPAFPAGSLLQGRADESLEFPAWSNDNRPPSETTVARDFRGPDNSQFF